MERIKSKQNTRSTLHGVMQASMRANAPVDMQTGGQASIQAGGGQSSMRANAPVNTRANKQTGIQARIHAGMQALSKMCAETLWPSRCVGCDVPGSLLCESCNKKLERINLELACPRCGAPWGHNICTECPNPGSVDRHEHPIKLPFCFAGARAACSFEGIAEKLIRSYKDHDERRCDKIIAAEIARTVCADASLENNHGEHHTGKHSNHGEHHNGEHHTSLENQQQKATENISENFTYAKENFDYIIPIPASKQAIKKRGFDHMACIAKCLEDLLDIEVLEILEPKKSADQRLLNAEERQKNKKGSFGIKPEYVCSKKAYALRAQTLKANMKKNAENKDGAFRGAISTSVNECANISQGANKSTNAGAKIPQNASENKGIAEGLKGVWCSPKKVKQVNYFLKGKRILLIDDVFTTGATLNAASEVLLENGAESVHVAVFARVW